MSKQFDLTKLPKSISDITTGLPWTFDTFGMSGSTILVFDEMVLKIEKLSRTSENELKLLSWLQGKLPVPKRIEAVQQDGYSFILQSRLSGEMACSDGNLQELNHTVKALAKALRQLWTIDRGDCPCSNVVAEKLSQVKCQIENKLVDTDHLDEKTLSARGFSSLWGLYDFLNENQPTQDFVFSHGDFCLPNVFISGEEITGYIDWGCGGIADRWQDITSCVRSLRYNAINCAGYNEADFLNYKKLLFNELEIEPDEDKIRYYCLLDELF